jgi:hypothetical protein
VLYNWMDRAFMSLSKVGSPSGLLRKCILLWFKLWSMSIPRLDLQLWFIYIHRYVSFLKIFFSIFASNIVFNYLSPCRQ